MTKPLYFYNGTTFEQVGPTTPQSPIAYQTSAPTGPATGDLWIDSDGDVDTYNRQLTRYYFVATAAQTTISGVDANSLTLAYVAGSEAVYVNGALQVRGQDYTATNGTSVVMSSALAVNDVVEIFAYTAFTVANAYTKTETDGVAAAAPGLRMVVPTSVSVGSGSGSVDANGNVTFSGASSVSINSCFTSTYDNYKIVAYIKGSADAAGKFRFRTSGSDNTTSNYWWGGYYQGYGATTTINPETGGGAVNTATISGVSSLAGGFAADVFSPLLTDYTLVCAPSADSYNRQYSIQFRATTSFDGFTFYPGSGTVTGSIRVYGYKN
jgi:hypothetical protein